MFPLLPSEICQHCTIIVIATNAMVLYTFIHLFPMPVSHFKLFVLIWKDLVPEQSRGFYIWRRWENAPRLYIHWRKHAWRSMPHYSWHEQNNSYSPWLGWLFSSSREDCRRGSRNVTICEGHWVSRAPSLKLPLWRFCGKLRCFYTLLRCVKWW